MTLGRARVLLLAIVGFGTGHLVPALTANVAVVGLGFFVAGLALMVFSITNLSIRQALLPSAVAGRVHATYRTTAYSAGLMGAALAAAIGEFAGLREAFAVGSACIFLGLLGGLVVTDRRIADAEEATSHTDPVLGRRQGQGESEYFSS